MVQDSLGCGPAQPREPVNTIVERTVKKLRAVIFDGGSHSPDVSRKVHIPQDTRTLTVLGWSDDTRIFNATLYPDHVEKNTPQFMTAL